MERTSETKPVTIVAIGAGNRTNKYLEYAIRNPDRLKLVGVAELNDIRRHAVASKFGLKPEECFTDYERFFENPVPADAILIGTPENMHFEPCMKAIEAGYNVLLEKPIAQSLPECCRIAEAARRKGVIVGVCHVLRYHPYFIKIKEIVDSGQLGEIISISHHAAVGLDRTTHGFVRGMGRREEITNPMLISKCCHDIDFLLWLTEARCRKLSSFGSLRWFRAENAPKGSTPRCIDCPLEKECPYSAVDLYYNRRDWISNFDVPEGATLDEVILRQLRTGYYGRCVFRCDNDVVDHQLLTMELADETILSLSMDIFTQDDCRRTHIKMTHGEIFGDELTVSMLPQHGKRHQPERPAGSMPRKPAGRSIEDRPEHINDRSTFGHWEMDSVESCQGVSNTYIVMTERKTRWELIIPSPDKTAASVVAAIDGLEAKYGDLFPKVFRSITCDNGCEFADAAGIERSASGKGTRTEVYYCHPYRPSERGSNENQNGLIRRHLPKGTDLSTIPYEETKRIEDWLNNYPRKMFGYLCSEQLFREEIALILAS